MQRDNIAHIYRAAALSKGVPLLIGALVCCEGISRAETELTTVRVVNGLLRPVFVTHAWDIDRLFVLEQDGKIRIIKNGALLSTAFLDVTALARCCNEEGLLGLAFDPDYAENGYFYINYTSDDINNSNVGNITLARYTVGDDPDVADPDSGLILMTIVHPEQANHNGGWLAFGPDGYLYMSAGDGGFRNDPENDAQTITGTLLGKMLRLDVSGDDFPDDPLRNYAIPPDNPFVGVEGDDEIWAYGLRNAWRNYIDPVRGTFYIADVGQDFWEEINITSLAGSSGANFGWRCMEATHCTTNGGCECNDPAHTLPRHEYSHGANAGTPSRCSITGGEVYDGCAIPDLRGTYFFADYCSNQVWSLRYTDGAVTDLQERTAELAPSGSLTLRTISSFGRDVYGELYICDRSGGEVFKIVAKNGPRIVASGPADGHVDPRVPPQKDDLGGIREIQITFDQAMDCPGRALRRDLALSVEGASGATVAIEGVERVETDTFTVYLSDFIPVGAWTRITHVPSGTSTRVGSLPGDFNGSGTTNAADIVDWIDAFNFVGPFASSGARKDIDRSFTINAGDLLTLIDLLDEGGDYQSFNGRSLLP